MEKNRNGARYFRNPPQPHMCIQDYIHWSEFLATDPEAPGLISGASNFFGEAMGLKQTKLNLGIQEPCYINVLSWGKISIPRRQDDPVPLYGGMRIPQSNLMANNKRVVIPRRPPIIFAVMINPQILKDSGKTATDPSPSASSDQALGTLRNEDSTNSYKGKSNKEMFCVRPKKSEE
uniref:Uncharacterized protein n=1 Tax=Timema tahoe TaxID=61484 RepID=A0A7R9IGR2_9NEOP|nr:unnamed protein product [Timema tahoe]